VSVTREGFDGGSRWRGDGRTASMRRVADPALQAMTGKAPNGRVYLCCPDEIDGR
jgi:hypothetical protein